MHFIEFIKTLPKQNDKRVQDFINLAVGDKSFPLTSDPSKLAIYLYRSLSPDATRGYQFCMMMDSQTPNNKLPKFCFSRQDMMMDAMNVIVSLQNFDSDYPWSK